MSRLPSELGEENKHDLFVWLTSLETVGGVTGTIAILVVITLCAGFLRNQTGNVGDIGKALIVTLSLIVGFYFGTAAGPKALSQTPTAASQPSSQ